MPNKRALVVDDSKTAQFKLNKILSDFDLTVDSVYSAEDALSYLAYKVPDIIFMDHSMKGMSGLDAVKIIKLNPVTAIIPVVMYTAEKGDVYVSQARAVGAMEVLSKDLMTESDIEQVMKSANILPKSKTATEKDGVDQNSEIIEEELSKPTEISANIVDVRNQVSRAIELQHSKIQRDIQDNSRMITRRLMHEVKELQNAIKQQEKPPTINMFADLVQGMEQPKQRSIFWFLIPMLCLIGLTAYGVYQIGILKKENQSLLDVNHQFASILAEQNDGIIASVERLENQNASRSEIINDDVFDDMLWDINENSLYEYGQFPLGANRTKLIDDLLFKLDEFGFKGIVHLNIHSGNYCVVSNGFGQFVLPEEGTKLSDCQLLDYYTPDPSQTEKTGIEFNTLLNTNPVLIKGDIDIAVNAYDQYSSTTPYPEYDGSIDASEWNDIALQNNNVLIELENY